MENKECVLTVIVAEHGGVKASFRGRHINKRELLRVLRLIKIEHREKIRKYRLNISTEQVQEEKKNIIMTSKNSVKEISNE